MANVPETRPAGHPRIGIAAMRVSLGTLAVLVSSFAVTIAVTSLYGASRETDAFYVARTLPDLVVVVFATASGIAAIPVLVRLRTEKGEAASSRLAGTILWSTLVVLLGAAVGAWFWRLDLAALLAPGFAPAERQLTASLLAITAPAVVLGGGFSVLAGALNARHRFFLPSLGPGLSNLVALLVVLATVDRGVSGWAIGYTLGSLVAFAMLLYAARTLVALLPPTFAVGASPFHTFLRTAAPYVFLAALLQVSSTLVRVIASTLDPGTITALAIALTLANVPLSLVAHALGTALVPALAESALVDPVRFRSLSERAYRALILMVFPTACLLIVSADSVIRVLFERGSFDLRATQLTAESLRLYATSLFAQPAIVVAQRGLLGAGRTGVIAVVDTASAIVLVTLTAVLAGPLQHRGVAAAYAAAATASAAFYLAARRSVGMPLPIRPGFLARVAAIAFVAALATWIALGALPQRSFAEQVMRLLTAASIGIGSYVALLHLLGLVRLHELLRSAHAALFSRP